MPALVTTEQLLAFAPAALSPAVTAESLSKHMARCEIATARRIRHFMAHLYVESGAFMRLEENLNYSCQRLQEVWPSRFPNPATAMKCARNPRELAAYVYNGRMGNEGPLDGYLYRGRAWIMLTGKINYRLASGWTGLDLVTNPQWAGSPQIASQIAADFWRVSGLNAIVDKDADEKVHKTLNEDILLNEDDDLKNATRLINGGVTSLLARRAALLRAAPIWK